MRGLRIETLQASYINKAVEFCDQEIGKNYFSEEDLLVAIKQSTKKDICCSLVLLDNEKVVGIRLTYPPGQWEKGRGQGMSVDSWPHALEGTAYFQSLFIHPSFQNQGWGRRLSEQSIERLKQLNTKGVVCHSWKESPGNSSTLYLKSLGFQIINEYDGYWSQIDYSCSLCGKPCECTAQEMYLDFNGEL